MPNATALVGELAPPRRRVATMMIVTNGFLLGAMAGGLASAWLIPAHGWRTVLVVGGALPLALVAPMLRWLPESPAFLAGRGERGAPVAELFRGGRGAATALLWGANFLNVLVAYLVASWLPAVLRDAGREPATAVLVGTAVQAGGAVGTVVVGLALQRVGFGAVLPACFAAAAAGLTLVASPGLPVPALFGVAAVVGWGVFAGQPGLNALAATLYPTDQRTTGIGAALGIGRLGAVFGPVLAGALLARGWDGEALFRAAAVPAAGTGLTMIVLGRLLPPAAPTPPRGR
jgi:AAHS family 4-hydroxybenzoate transporter-like MFS transporter